jgi:hypothetical protein
MTLNPEKIPSNYCCFLQGNIILSFQWRIWPVF